MTRLAPLFALLAAVLVARPARAELKLAYVDLQRAIQDSDDGKKAKAKLKAEFEKKQKELDGRQEELRRLKNDLDKQEATLSKEALATKKQELQLKLLQLQESFTREQQAMQAKESEELGALLRRAAGVVAAIAQAEGISYVLEKNSSLVYAPPASDLTNEVLRKLNAGTATSTPAPEKPKK